ncbi:MAG: ribonuclease HI family protein [Lentisphaeria bacterium]|nr:ribonuclease HI family protein [Candidatus Neomarinimicrobiota bacterium]MCF7842100.1 ribonuclease HI family protein [Lentisphaeria bacterium]
MSIAQSVYQFLDERGFFQANPGQEEAVRILLGLNERQRQKLPESADFERKASEQPYLQGDVDLEIFVDGAADLQKKAAGIGGAFFRKGMEIYSFAEYLPDATNNQAEYTALCKALEIAAQFDVKSVRVSSDSQLMIRQLNGEYRVKHANMKPLYEQAKRLAGKFDRIEYVHISRQLNKLADKLSKIGMSKSDTAQSRSNR